jgi:hypothetical protein
MQRRVFFIAPAEYSINCQSAGLKTNGPICLPVLDLPTSEACVPAKKRCAPSNGLGPHCDVKARQRIYWRAGRFWMCRVPQMI